MKKRITWAGIDDHKLKLTVAVVRGAGKEPAVTAVANEDAALRRWVRRLVPREARLS